MWRREGESIPIYKFMHLVTKTRHHLSAAASSGMNLLSERESGNSFASFSMGAVSVYGYEQSAVPH